jgi:transposase
MRKIEELSEEEKSELEAIKKSYSSYRERNRASGILLSYRGYSPIEIADIFEVTRRMVYHWLDEFRDEGVKSVFRKEGQGRKAILPSNKSVNDECKKKSKRLKS